MHCQLAAVAAAGLSGANWLSRGLWLIRFSGKGFFKSGGFAIHPTNLDRFFCKRFFSYSLYIFAPPILLNNFGAWATCCIAISVYK